MLLLLMCRIHEILYYQDCSLPHITSQKFNFEVTYPKILCVNHLVLVCKLGATSNSIVKRLGLGLGLGLGNWDGK